MRKSQGRDYVHYVPQHLSRWVENLRHTSPSIDVFWGTCTPPDARGFVSLGLNACYETEMLRHAKKIILEINPNMPVTFGATIAHVNEITHFIQADYELPAFEPAVPSEIDMVIGRHIAELIADGSTIQLGIGGIPNAVGKALVSKRDLGIHTEMINDAMMDLYLAGVVTGRQKTLWPGKMVGAFAYGSNKLYAFINKNPAIELQPASVVNDSYRISRNHQMISINTAVEVDITGQVCSESVGHRELSGVGGAFETHVGAQRSNGGRGIIAIPSTTKNGLQSKIVFELLPGAKVSISRNDVDTVITEFGVAQLMGRSVAERVRALAGIAHPKFRDELLVAARRERYI
jgi:acyl-CoA hydrolase